MCFFIQKNARNPLQTIYFWKGNELSYLFSVFFNVFGCHGYHGRDKKTRKCANYMPQLQKICILKVMRSKLPQIVSVWNVAYENACRLVQTPQRMVNLSHSNKHLKWNSFFEKNSKFSIFGRFYPIFATHMQISRKLDGESCKVSSLVKKIKVWKKSMDQFLSYGDNSKSSYIFVHRPLCICIGNT